MPETITSDLRKMLGDAMSEPSEDIARSILMRAGADPGTLEKTISTSTGLVAYDLQAPAKNLYPVATPIRNRLPRVGGGVGVATNWRQVNAIVGSGFDSMGWVPEGQRAGKMSYSTSSKAASFVTIGEEDAVTYEAISAGRTFEDVQAGMATRLLQKTLLKEEMALLGGNATMPLGTPAQPSLSASAVSGSTLPAATYSVIVVALTFEGVRNSSLSGGVATTKTITGADGQTFTLNGGSSNRSANATQAVAAGQGLAASVTAIQGAAGYAWFVGAAGSETLQAITSINSALFSATLASGAQPVSAISADCSTNSLAFDGLLTWALKAGSGAYVSQLATGAAGTGTTLTASGRGTVNEIDQMFETMWDSYQVSPSVLYVNSRQLRDITTKCLTGASGPLLQLYQDPSSPVQLTAGGVIDYYFNPFTLDGGSKIPVKIHPYVPPGMIIGWAEDLPAQYQNSEVPNCAEVKTRQDYYAIDWPITTRQRQKGVYTEEVLAVYAPFAMGCITNIAPG